MFPPPEGKQRNVGAKLFWISLDNTIYNKDVDGYALACETDMFTFNCVVNLLMVSCIDINPESCVMV